MKITKLIIPLLSLASINGANNQISQVKVIQLEDLPKFSYEVSVKDNWDNYYYLTNNNITGNSIKDWVELTQPNTKKNDLESRFLVRVVVNKRAEK